MNASFKCYAEGRPGQWEIVCLDLDLAAQGRTLDEAVARMSEAIELHLEYVHSLPPAEQRQFLRRKAPLGMRLKFIWHVIRSIWRRDGDNGKQRAEFLLPCHP